jgi:hypothetical protein
VHTRIVVVCHLGLGVTWGGWKNLPAIYGSFRIHLGNITRDVLRKNTHTQRQKQNYRPLRPARL